MWVPRGELLAPCVFLVGVRRKEECWSVSRPPSRTLMLLAFWAGWTMSLALFSHVTSAEAAPAALLWVSCDLVPWR